MVLFLEIFVSEDVNIDNDIVKNISIVLQQSKFPRIVKYDTEHTAIGTRIKLGVKISDNVGLGELKNILYRLFDEINDLFKELDIPIDRFSISFEGVDTIINEIVDEWLNELVYIR